MTTRRPPPLRLRDLSYRVKIPLAITAVILITEVVVTTLLVTRAATDARRDLEASARSLTDVLGRSLRDPMVRDDLWQSFEVIRTPLAARAGDSALRDIIVTDAEARVFVASDPVAFPVAAESAVLPDGIAELLGPSTTIDRFRFVFDELPKARYVSAGGPIRAEDGSLLGSVFVLYDPAVYMQRVQSSLLNLAALTVPGLLLLIPLGWYGGKRIAEPLAGLARTLQRVGREPSDALARVLPPVGADEIGQLSLAARTMLDGLARKEALEVQMVSAERLAAVGRVSAAVAHEINNPLGGMLNAIDTLDKHGDPDPLTRRTLGLLQRGLQQIRATTSALLVEARLDSPALVADDWVDLRTLIEPQLTARAGLLRWSVPSHTALAVPAHQIRQLVLNLLLNAANATEVGGTVSLSVALDNHVLVIEVGNTGRSLAPDQLARLFEPFVTAGDRSGKRSYGLGLWVCYQIVQQLRGTIVGASESGATRFTVRLPVALVQPAVAEEV